MALCEICTILPELDQELTLAQGDHWVANLRPNDQTLLGTSFITANRHVPELDQLTTEEEQEFIMIRNALIVATRAAFKPITFNVSCLKNDAFKAAPDTTPAGAAHVHWHVKPRYPSTLILFNDEVFADPLPGQYLSSYERHAPSYETALAIAQAIRNRL